MPRANRHFLPDQLWHITHRCHQKAVRLACQGRLGEADSQGL